MFVNKHFKYLGRPYLRKYSRVSNGRGRRNKRRLANFAQNNKRGGWQISPKLINGEAGINGETGKNTAIRNFIEIKSSNDLVKISTKRT